jgi:hypothetical protein
LTVFYKIYKKQVIFIGLTQKPGFSTRSQDCQPSFQNQKPGFVSQLCVSPDLVRLSCGHSRLWAEDWQCPTPAAVRRLRDNIGTQANLILDLRQADFWDSSRADGAAVVRLSEPAEEWRTAASLWRTGARADYDLRNRPAVSGRQEAMNSQLVSGKALWPGVVGARLASIPGATLARLAHIVLEYLPGFGA